MPEISRRGRALVLSAAVLSITAVASCARPADPALPVAAPEELGLSPRVLERADSVLEAFVDAGQLGGVYAVIARGGRIGYERTFGWRDVGGGADLRRDDVFRIYSMTKPVTAVAILRLVEEGRVSLDDPISRYIPAFGDVKVFVGGTAADPVLEAPHSPITIRQLLNHTSGLAYGLTRSPVDTLFAAAKLYDAERTLEAFADSLARVPLLFHPGTAWSYSSGLDVAGRVVEIASGRPLDRFLEEELFRPLGMRDTAFRIRPDVRDRLVTVYRPGPAGELEVLGRDGLMAMFEPGARFFWGSGGLISTPDDYLRFAQMLLNGGALGEARVLRPETVAMLTGDTVPFRLGRPAGSILKDPTYRFGLGVAVKVDTVGALRPGPAGIFRWSGYLGTYFWIDPSHDMIAMVWTQLSPGSRYPIEARFQELVYEALAEGVGRE
jgi:CubicO group peptidase (beta-lactamase class C family)